MNPDLVAIAAALTDILDQENRALTALDLPCAMALLERKHRATDALLAAKDGIARPRDRAALQLMVGRLEALAEDNRRLLERAIEVQGRVIALVARSAPKRLPEAPRYTAAGSLAGANRTAPVAFSARA